MLRPEQTAPSAAGAAVAVVPVTARGKADFDRAIGFMKAGNVTEAELEFKQVALQFPQLSSPYVNLGILYRKAGHLDQSEDALKTAVERNDGSAVAWTELGATQRLRGEFPSAAASYEKAIAADPNFAPAYRNLGVVSDLYLGDPERALTAFERYKELTGEEKPVSGWIAELRARTGKPPLKRPPAAPGATPQAAPANRAQAHRQRRPPPIRNLRSRQRPLRPRRREADMRNVLLVTALLVVAPSVRACVCALTGSGAQQTRTTGCPFARCAEPGRPGARCEYFGACAGRHSGARCDTRCQTGRSEQAAGIVQSSARPHWGLPR